MIPSAGRITLSNCRIWLTKPLAIDIGMVKPIPLEAPFPDGSAMAVLIPITRLRESSKTPLLFRPHPTTSPEALMAKVLYSPAPMSAGGSPRRPSSPGTSWGTRSSEEEGCCSGSNAAIRPRCPWLPIPRVSTCGDRVLRCRPLIRSDSRPHGVMCDR